MMPFAHTIRLHELRVGQPSHGDVVFNNIAVLLHRPRNKWGLITQPLKNACVSIQNRMPRPLQPTLYAGNCSFGVGIAGRSKEVGNDFKECRHRSHEDNAVTDPPPFVSYGKTFVLRR